MLNLNKLEYELNSDEYSENTKILEIIKEINSFREKHPNLPIILNFIHLASYFKINSKILYRFSNSEKYKCYRTFEIPKRNGKTRCINSPYPLLYDIQKWILTNILNQQNIHQNVFSYKKNSNILNNAEHHVGCKYLYKFDINKFFENIDFHIVKNLFIKIGYSRTVSIFLANLCCHNNSLPQGACTSPMISNLILYDFDNDINTYVGKNLSNGKYSRYADDITISSCNKGDSRKLQIFIREKLAEYNLQLNNNKTKSIGVHQSKIVTGLLVKKDKVRITKKYRKTFRTESYFAIKNFNNEKLNEDLINNPFHIEKLIGKATFILKIEPENQKVKEIKNKLINMLKFMNTEI